MFGFIKKMLRKSLGGPDENAQVPGSEPAPVSYAASYPAPHLAQRSYPRQTGKGIAISLQAILDTLPLELQPRVRKMEVGELSIMIPLEKVLAQLSRGAVKIPFGELRQLAPELFSPEADRDRVPVPLPLAEILAQLNPALICRRRVQRQVEVPAEIISPFEGGADGLVFSVGPTKPEPEPAPVINPPRHSGAAQAPGHVPGRLNLTGAPTPPAPTAFGTPGPAQPVVPGPKPPSPAPKVNPLAQQPPAAPPTPVPAAPIRFNFNPVTPPPAVPPPAPPEVPSKAPPAPALPRMPRNGKGGQPPLASAAVPPPPRSASPTDPLILSLTAVAEGWPEAIRKEIVEFKLVDTKLALPMHAVEQALKQGRIVFSWKMLRSFMKPAGLQAASPLDSTVLELPLSVVAPLFLARQREAAKPQQKIAIDEDIPNLFFGFPQPDSAPPPPSGGPEDTNFYVWDDSNDTVRVHESELKRGPSPGTKFVAKYATPNEVVSRAAALDGVAGALIALPDGLMVANLLPPDLNADTLAAFLPQIFGKVSQCTKELRMGELNNLNFTVGNVPWKIFRVNAIFFAAFGRAGKPLPTAQLAALAAELDHKPK